MLIDSVELYRRFNNASTDRSSLVVIWMLIIGLPEKIDMLMPYHLVRLASLFSELEQNK